MRFSPGEQTHDSDETRVLSQCLSSAWESLESQSSCSVDQFIGENFGAAVPKLQPSQRKALRKILDSALLIDDMRMRSRAYIYLQWPWRSAPEDVARDRYDDNLTEMAVGPEEHGRKTRVKIFLTPIMFKRGNADGKLYDTKMVLVKGDVLLE